jgi:hypothetical protein
MVEEKLDRPLDLYAAGQPRRGAGQGGGVPHGEPRLPVDPRPSAVRLFDGGKGGIGIEPGRLPKGFELVGSTPAEESAGGQDEKPGLVGDQSGEVDSLPRQSRQLLDLLALQQPLGHEVVEIDQERIAGKRRGRLVWRIPVTGRADREHLPEVLPSLGQGPGKLAGARAQGADPVRVRQRRDVGEHPALAPHSAGNCENRIVS